MLEIVADHEHRDPGIAQPGHELEHLAALVDAQSRHRFVHDQELGLGEQEAADRDGLPLAARKTAHRLVQGRQGDRKPLEQLAGLLPHRRLIELGQDAQHFFRDLTAQEDVLRHVQRVDEAQALVHRLDPGDVGVARGLEGHRLAFDDDLAAIRLDCTREGLDQRRLAGAVVADQRKDFAAPDLQAYVVHSAEPAVIFVEIANRNQDVATARAGRGGFGHFCLPYGRSHGSLRLCC